MKCEVLRLPAMEKMDLLVAHLGQLLQATGKSGGESSAVKSDRLQQGLNEETGSGGRQGVRSFSLAPLLVGEPSGIQPEIPLQSTEGAFGRSQQFGQDFRPLRMELPLFAGENPDGWVYRIERYFLLMHMNNSIIGLDGDALTWFQWENQRRPISSWVHLKQQLLLRFRSSPVGSVSEELLSVTQITTVRDYRHRWEMLA